MRADIAALQHRLRVTTVYVTHDQVEAMTMGERVAVLRDGRLQQCGTPRELYDRPRNRFVAGFIGSPAMNLCPAPLLAGGSAELDGVRVDLGDEAASAAADGLAEVVVGLRPEALEPAVDGIKTKVEVVEELGSDAYAVCVADLPGGELRLTVRVDPWRAPTPGERLALRPRAGEGHAFHPETGERIGPLAPREETG
jgi:multiple sugar transport system ATP-binding protein